MAKSERLRGQAGAAARRRRDRRVAEGFDRTGLLIDAGVDLLVVDAAHGHSRLVLNAVTRIKQRWNKCRWWRRNMATGEGAQALIDAGADDQGRRRAGLDLHHPHRRQRFPACRSSPPSWMRSRSHTKARPSSPTAAWDARRSRQGARRGADCAMVGSLLAGTRRDPGRGCSSLSGPAPTRPLPRLDSVGAHGAAARANRCFQQGRQGHAQARTRRRRGPGAVQGRGLDRAARCRPPARGHGLCRCAHPARSCTRRPGFEFASRARACARATCTT